MAGAFNEMLGELDQARSRELTDRAEQAARQRLSVLLNASPAVIYCREASGDYQPTFVSDSVTRLFGCTPREYLDNPYLWRDRVHPDDVPRISAWVDKMFESDKRALEYRIRRTDGTYFWVNDEQYVVRNAKGDPVEIVGSWTDVTERKEAEQARERARQRLDLLLRAAPVVVYSFAATGDYAPTFVSASIGPMLGYTPDEYLEDADFWRGHVHPEDLPEIEAKQVELFRAGRASLRISLPQEGRHVLLGQRRAASHSRRGRPPGRSRGLLERHRRPQSRRAGVPGRAGGAEEGDRRGA